MLSRGRAHSLMAKTGCPFPMVRSALGFVLLSTKRTYLALLRLSLASCMGMEMQNRPSERFFTKGGPGCAYLGELLMTCWFAPVIVTGGDGDRILWRSGGDGDAT